MSGNDHLPQPPDLPGAAVPPMPPAPQPDVVPPVATPPSLAARHETQATRTYPCAQCGNNLVFDPKPMCLVCPACGLTRAVLVKNEPITKRPLHAMASSIPASELSKEIVCQNCGGHTTFNGSMTAIRCPYCATPIQRDDLQDSPARLPVDGIIPFGVDKPSAKEALEKWIGSRWFAPTEFKKFNEIGSFNSVYLSYWTYDTDTITDYTGQKGITRTRVERDGDQERTVTYTEWYPVSGVVHDSIQDLPVLANEGLDLYHVTELEPWPMESAACYTPDFVAGHLARTYDSDAQEVFTETGEARVKSRIESTIRWDIGGDQQMITSMSVHYNFLNFAQLLLPVWLMAVVFRGTTYQVFINGITGEVQGDRPYSPTKIAFAVFLALVVVAIGVWLYTQ